ncbi:membrane protein [Megasphaera cerevisiae DSM 20462]|jgi:uncharacterized membrane protein|uniref:Membrane protein n=1 Tax=Megasphaera cerevisiae DSM 20462 TaxID=1122219 RepID=A0A0J6WWG0_9FIRM|nr:ECF transporter S component [Megasphaera cerevisiae]KMO86152.1 membrane protein [Megasphaera cerevisiae DSM 20462]SJZ39848.1 Uncharacterized membrane protein [Megasphaera cerevisiae DSM 20462]
MQKELGMKRVGNVRKRPLFTTRDLTIIGMLSGITILLGVTGYGFIPLPMMKATILHVPVIIGALVAGPRVGSMVGFIFGCFSIFQAVTAPVLLSFAFLNPLISILPRVFIGIGAYYIYKWVLAAIHKETVSLAIAGIAGSMINTVGVMGGIYIIYAKDFAQVREIPLDNVINIILGICVFNGIPEAIISAVITVPVIAVLKKAVKNK